MTQNVSVVALLVDTMLLVEWSTLDNVCPRCWAPRLRDHYPDCQLDAALTRVGFDTRAKRDEYRRSR